jgi:hypothetical protein
MRRRDNRYGTDVDQIAPRRCAPIALALLQNVRSAGSNLIPS